MDLLAISANEDKTTLAEQRQKTLRASLYDPFNPLYKTTSAYIADRLDLVDEAEQEYPQALLLEPVNADTLQQFGTFLSTIEGGRGRGRSPAAGIDYA
nr:hypothetical protein [uncultured Desulfobulbus sp.]